MNPINVFFLTQLSLLGLKSTCISVLYISAFKQNTWWSKQRCHLPVSQYTSLTLSSPIIIRTCNYDYNYLYWREGKYPVMWSGLSKHSYSSFNVFVRMTNNQKFYKAYSHIWCDVTYSSRSSGPSKSKATDSSYRTSWISTITPWM